MVKTSLVFVSMSFLVGLTVATFSNKISEEQAIWQEANQRIVVEISNWDIPPGSVIKSEDVERREFSLSTCDFWLSPFPECWNSSVGMRLHDFVSAGTAMACYLKYPKATRGLANLYRERRELELLNDGDAQ